jgi:hypothetical protein
MVTKRGKKCLRNRELKKMMVILEYLAKDVANATTFVEVEYLYGSPFETKLRCHSFIVFVNLKSGNCLGLPLTQHLLDLISPN